MNFSGPAQEHLFVHRDPETLSTPPLRVADGSLWSIQASEAHACFPRTDYRVGYKAAEVMIVRGDEPHAWRPWKRGDVYAWLPLAMVDQEIARRGGLAP